MSRLLGLEPRFGATDGRPAAPNPGERGAVRGLNLASMSPYLPTLRLMPDYAADRPLWGADLNELNLSGSVVDELGDWQQQFDDNFDPLSGWSSDQVKAEWAERAAVIEMELRIEIKGKAWLEVDLWTLDERDH
jgi:hypothetical protein